MSSSRNRVGVILAFLVVLSLAYFVAMPGATEMSEFQRTWLSSQYRVALEDHLLEYLAYSPLKPPLFSVLHAAAAKIGAITPLGEAVALHGLAALLNILVAPLLYGAMRNFGAYRTISAIFAGLASLSLIVVSRAVLNYDAPLFFFESLFLFAQSRVWKNSDGRGWLLVGVSAVLLVLQSTVQAIVVPACLIVLIVANVARGRPRKNIAWAMAVMTAIFLAVTGLVLKNERAVGVAVNSTLGGHTLLLFTQNLANWDYGKMHEWMSEAGAPSWYIWCFEHPADWQQAGPRREIMSALGHCWYPDRLDELQDRMSSLGAEVEAQAVQRDIERWREKPYLLSGVAADMATEWFARYHQVSASVARYVFMSDPVRWLRNATYLHGSYFSYRDYDVLMEWIARDSTFDARLAGIYRNAVLVPSNWIRFGIHRSVPYLWLLIAIGGIAAFALTAFGHVGRPRSRIVLRCATALILSAALFWFAKYAFDWAYYGFERAFYWKPAAASILVSCILICFIAIRMERKGEAARGWTILETEPPIGGAVLLLIPVTLLSVVFCTVVYSENHRFFLQLLPYQFGLAAILVSWLVRLFDAVRRGLTPMRAAT